MSKTEAELKAIIDDMANGDQSWRSTVRERYADHLRERSARSTKGADDMVRIGCTEDHAKGLRDLAAKQSKLADKIESGEQSINIEEAEAILRIRA